MMLIGVVVHARDSVLLVSETPFSFPGANHALSGEGLTAFVRTHLLLSLQYVRSLFAIPSCASTRSPRLSQNTERKRTRFHLARIERLFHRHRPIFCRRCSAGRFKYSIGPQQLHTHDKRRQ